MSLPLIVRGLLRSVHTTEVVYPPRTDIRCTPASRAEPGNPRQLLVRSTRPLLGRAKAGQCSLYFDHTSLRNGPSEHRRKKHAHAMLAAVARPRRISASLGQRSLRSAKAGVCAFLGWQNFFRGRRVGPAVFWPSPTLVSHAAACLYFMEGKFTARQAAPGVMAVTEFAEASQVGKDH